MVTLGFAEIRLPNRKGILGDLENGTVSKSIILITKKVIYNAMKDEEFDFTIKVKL